MEDSQDLGFVSFLPTPFSSSRDNISLIYQGDAASLYNIRVSAGSLSLSLTLFDFKTSSLYLTQ